MDCTVEIDLIFPHMKTEQMEEASKELKEMFPGASLYFTRHCDFCEVELPLEGSPQTIEECPKCAFEYDVCTNCRQSSTVACPECAK